MKGQREPCVLIVFHSGKKVMCSTQKKIILVITPNNLIIFVLQENFGKI